MEAAIASGRLVVNGTRDHDKRQAGHNLAPAWRARRPRLSDQLFAKIPQMPPLSGISGARSRLQFFKAFDVTEHCAGYALKLRTKQKTSRGGRNLLNRL